MQNHIHINTGSEEFIGGEGDALAGLKLQVYEALSY
jgi:hypothetical protein